MSRNNDYIIHTRLEPTDILITGKQKRETSTLFEQWKWLDGLTDEQREQMKLERAEEIRRAKEWQ